MWKRFVTALLLTACLASLASAGDYLLGSDGYYHSAGRRYSRSIVSEAGYWRCGAYYPGASYYSYTPVVEQQVYVPPVAATPAAFNENEAIINLAKLRVKQQHSLELAQALGLSVTYPGQGTVPFAAIPGQGYNVTATGQTTTQVYGAQANTVYGYKFGNLDSFYAPTDLSTLYQMANQLAFNAQTLGGQATGDFQKLVQQEGTARSNLAQRLAERDILIARGQTAVAILNALQSPGGVSTNNYSITISPKTGVQTNSSKATPADKAAVWKAWQASATKCAACHAGAKSQGGFVVDDYPGLANNLKEVVIARLTTPDLKLRMPRKPDGTAGEPLPQDEVKAWLFVEPRPMDLPKP